MSAGWRTMTAAGDEHVREMERILAQKNKANWVGPGEGERVSMLLGWIGRCDPELLIPDLATSLKIVWPGQPTAYDRERVAEALRLVGYRETG